MTGSGRLIIVCGLPGSGKTTRSRALARTLNAMRFAPDDWMDALGIDLWDEARRAAIEALQWTLAEDLISAGGTAIVEWGTWARSERDALREGARKLGAAVELIYLDASADELFARIRKRNREVPPVERADVDEWVQSFQKPTTEELALYDPPAEHRP